MDGIPINTADGYGDFQEIDPTAYRYVEVFKGASALRYGSNALGGAINLVTPTGRDAAPYEARFDIGSFGYVKGQASTGGADGALDWFATLSRQQIDGYRQHSDGDAIRGNMNLGYRFTPDFETRFYFFGAGTNQRIPGEVTKAGALNNPRAANPGWVAQDQQRNVESHRIANKSTWRLGETVVEFGGFYNNRHLDHPIFQYLDYTVDDYGGFIRAVDDRQWGGLRNRLIVGGNIHNGVLNTDQFVNLPGAIKGAQASSMVDTSENYSLYLEDSLYVQPNLALIASFQYLDASRDRRDRFLTNGDQSGRKHYGLFSPRFGVLWDVSPDWQIFGNVSRSAEIPSYDTNAFSTPANSNLRAQRATSYEIGTRGRGGILGWDLSLYRSHVRDELQCLATGPSTCAISNAGDTVHQGVEAGLEADIPISAFVPDDRLAVTAAYTFNDFFFEDDAVFGNNELPGVPRHFLRAETLYKHPSGVYAGPNIEWAPGHYYADNANSLAVDPYALFNFRLGYDTGRGWSGYVEGRNLTDERYIATVAVTGFANAASQIFNPGTGRSLYGGPRYGW
jgi:iron complex outermembrane receptor protein